MRSPASLLTLLLLACIPAFAQQPPCQSTVTGHLDIFPLTSATFHNTRNLRVWLPPGYDDPVNAATQYPVLYLLDGASVFDACTAFAHDELHADETLTDLIASGKIPPLIAVAIDSASDLLDHPATADGNALARAREYLPWPDPLLPGDKHVFGDRLPDFLEQEVMPAVAARYRIFPDSSHAALWGDSYAGTAALNIAVRRPDLFAALIIESPSIQPGNGQILRDTLSLVAVPTRIALGIGTQELDPNAPGGARLNAAWVAAMHTLADNLRAATFIPPQVQLTIAEGAHHATGDFGKRLRAALLFLYGTPEPTPATH